MLQFRESVQEYFKAIILTQQRVQAEVPEFGVSVQVGGCPVEIYTIHQLEVSHRCAQMSTGITEENPTFDLVEVEDVRPLVNSGVGKIIGSLPWDSINHTLSKAD
jgi:hypothetical protein